MSHEAIVLDLAEQDLHLSLVEDVLRKDVLVGWVTRRPMHELEFPFVDVSGKLAEKIPAAINHHGRSRTIVQLIPSPVDRLESHWVETIGIEQGGLIVITQNRDLA